MLMSCFNSLERAGPGHVVSASQSLSNLLQPSPTVTPHFSDPKGWNPESRLFAPRMELEILLA